MKYISQFTANGIQFDIGSDWHIKLGDEDFLRKFTRRLLDEKQSGTLFCMGDIFDTSEGQDASPGINWLLTQLSYAYDHIIFTPGNHCLRGRENPWDSFQLPRNVHYSHMEGGKVPTPEQVDIQGQRILIGNIFYDMEFINPAIIGLTIDDVVSFYKDETNDGKHLLKGDFSLFREMRNVMIDRIYHRVDIIATHALPHPSLVTFRVPEKTPEMLDYEKHLGIPFICDSKADEADAIKYKTTPDLLRRYWNYKSLVMGSDLFKSSDFKDGVYAVYGHNHRSNISSTKIFGRTMNFVSHQPNPWKHDYPVERAS